MRTSASSCPKRCANRPGSSPTPASRDSKPLPAAARPVNLSICHFERGEKSKASRLPQTPVPVKQPSVRPTPSYRRRACPESIEGSASREYRRGKTPSASQRNGEDFQPAPTVILESLEGSKTSRNPTRVDLCTTSLPHSQDIGSGASPSRPSGVGAVRERPLHDTTPQ